METVTAKKKKKESMCVLGGWGDETSSIAKLISIFQTFSPLKIYL